MSTRNLRVIIIDDDEDTCDLMSRHVKDLDPDQEIYVQMEANGELGLAALNAERFDLIITDFLMPNMNGMEMITNIRTGSGCNQATPIICITGHLPMIDDKIPGHILNKVEFFEKPYDINEIHIVFKEYLAID